jgi:hypothetical protein
MDVTGIPFNWAWLVATLAGTLLGFIAGELIERAVTRRRARGRPKLSLMTGKKSGTRQTVQSTARLRS